MSEESQLPAGELRISRGAILAYRIFDIGDEVALDAAERMLADAPGRKRATLTRDGAKCLQVAVSPLDVSLGKRKVELAPGRTVEAEVTVRFYEYGAASVVFEVPIAPGIFLADLVPVCAEIYDSPVLEALARREVDLLLSRLRGAADGRPPWHAVETYTVVFVEALEGNPSPARILASPVLPKLLLGELGPKKLSDEECGDVLKHAHAYFEDDLTVIDWNSAFVLQPSGNRDIPHILEFATSQLLELRYYDDLLDAELARIYSDFATARRDWRTVIRSPYSRLARQVIRRIVEVTEFTERVDNSLKVVGDFYLARVYQSSVRRFRIPAWRSSVDAKQALVERAYELLKGEVEIRRSTLLELIVIVLIVLELFVAFRGGR
jgi:hypothetical protein